MGSKNRLYVDIMDVHQEVTGSCHLVIAKLPNKETIRFVVDCGLFQESKYECLNYELPFNSDNIEFCLVTHNHIDHTGRLPFLVRKEFNGKIYATETTCKLMPLALRDNLKIMRDTAKRRNQKALYDETDVETTISFFKPMKYNETYQINENVKVTFLENGHLVGAAVILVQIMYPGYDTINLLFTGDYNNKNMFFDVAPIPKWVLELPLTVIQEATYGTMNKDEMHKCFEDNIRKHIKEEETILIPVFALGRAQEILYVLKKMQQENKLDVEIPIYLDSKLTIKYTKLYQKDGLEIKQEMRDFLPENLTLINSESRSEVIKNTEKKIILTTSGMGSYGPAQTYIPLYITSEKAFIQFTGYTAENTLGGRLKKTEKGDMVQVGGMMVKKVAEVEYTTEFSAHAKADEMIEFLKQFSNLKLILVNHGETETKENFAKRIAREVTVKGVGLLGRDYFFRVNPYGFVKSLSTKFI